MYKQYNKHKTMVLKCRSGHRMQPGVESSTGKRFCAKPCKSPMRRHARTAKEISDGVNYHRACYTPKKRRSSSKKGKRSSSSKKAKAAKAAKLYRKFVAAL